MTPLADACREIMQDSEIASRYPKGLTSTEILAEIRAKDPGAFPLVTPLDVADTMWELFG